MAPDLRRYFPVFGDLSNRDRLGKERSPPPDVQFDAYQAVEKRDPPSRLWCESSSCPPVPFMQRGVVAVYRGCVSFLRIRVPCITSFCTSLREIRFINGLL